MIRLIQLLCSRRHAFIVMAYESDTGEASPAKLDAMRKTVDDFVNRGIVNPSCRLCGSTDLNFEDWETSFANMDEAGAELGPLQHSQLKTAQHLKESGKVFDPRGSA